MKKAVASMNSQARKRARLKARLTTWAVILAVVGLAGYGLSQMSGIAYGEDDIRAVNFSALNEQQKQSALESANAARCTCGCGMGLAQCVSTDMTCPIRDGNIEKIRAMVQVAQAQP